MGTHTEIKVRNTPFWEVHIDAWRRSGRSQRDYCESSGLALSTFQFWRRRLAGQDSSVRPGECVELVPVPKTFQLADSKDSRQAAIVLCLGAYRLEINDGVHAHTLRSVIDVLEAR